MAVLIALALLGCDQFVAEAATSAGPVPVARELASGGYFGGVKKGMLILNLSNEGKVQTYYASSGLKVWYQGASIDLAKLPLNTPIRVITDRGGSLTRVEVLGAEK